MMTHSSLVNTFTAFNRIWEITGRDRFLHVLPTFHAHGLMMAILCPLFANATIVLTGRFDVDEVIRQLPDTTAGIVLLDRYGSTEAGMVAANPVGRSRRGSVGRIFDGVDLRVLDASGVPAAQGAPGRIQVRGANVFFGYWNRPELDAQTWSEDGYFDTGDLGVLDEDGFLFIVGRDKDMIISGGFNVYPREIEIALEEIEGVAEAAVFGVPHPDFGEGVVAVVIAEPGVKIEPTALAARLAGCLTAYKRPKCIRIVEDFPRNQVGKLLRKELAEKLAAMFSRVA